MMQFVYMAIARISPEQSTKAIRALVRENGLPGCNTGPGGCQTCLVESLDEPGKLLWITYWEHQSSFREMVTSPQYAERLARLRPCLLAEPEWYGYRVLNPMPNEEPFPLKEVQKRNAKIQFPSRNE
jgi:quinol monooxygenase YgiN